MKKLNTYLVIASFLVTSSLLSMEQNRETRIIPQQNALITALNSNNVEPVPCGITAIIFVTSSSLTAGFLALHESFLSACINNSNQPVPLPDTACLLPTTITGFMTGSAFILATLSGGKIIKDAYRFIKHKCCS